MDLILDALSRWGERLKGSARLPLALLALAALGAGLVALSHLLVYIPLVSNTVGGLAGGAWFVAAFLVWAFVLPENLRERTRFRAIYPLPKRRKIAMWAFLGWAGILVFVGGRIADGPLLGAVNVVVLLTLWRVFTMTAEERTAMEAALASTEDTWSLPDGKTESELDLEDMFGDEEDVAEEDGRTRETRPDAQQ